MSRPPLFSGPRLAALAIALLVMSLVAAAVWVVDWTENAHPLDFLAAALPAAGFVVTLVIWAKRSTAPAERLAADKKAAEVLADIVERQWREEARHRLMDDPHPMPVQWHLTADETVMSRPSLISTAAQLTLTGRSDDIATLAGAFRGLTRRRLVIAGGAGTGKTTLAIQLLLHLLSTRAADQAAEGEGEVVPVPVLLPVSGWDTSAHPRLQDWLTARLVQDYPALAAPQLGADAAAALVDGGHILAVLDGLDEIPASARAQVIAALNTSLTARDQLILTSRRAEFTTAVHEAGRPLNAAAVIVPRPLPPQAAADYLAACLPASPSLAWSQTLDALRSRTVPGLTQLAATPLGLWLIHTVYVTPGADPAPLTGPLGADADALRTHLLDHVIPAVIAARPPSTDPADHFRPRHRLDPDTTRRHLTYLAHVFPPAATRDIAWWRIARNTPHIRATIGLATGAAFAVAFGLIWMALGIAWAPPRIIPWGNPRPIAPWAVLGLAFGLAFGFTFGFVSGLVRARSWVNEQPGYADLRLRGRSPLLFHFMKGTFKFGLTTGLRAGLTLGLGLVLIVSQFDVDRDAGVSFEPEQVDFAILGFGLMLALLIGLGITLVYGLITWAEQPTLASTSTPRSSRQADRALSLLRLVASGLAVGLVFGPFLWVTAKDGLGTEHYWIMLTRDLAVWLALALTLGLGAGVVMGKHHAWLVCTIAVARIAHKRRLPWRIMDFLDDAHRLGLLRAVGPVYQFRHAALHDYLYAGHRQETSFTRIMTSPAVSPGGERPDATV